MKIFITGGLIERMCENNDPEIRLITCLHNTDNCFFKEVERIIALRKEQGVNEKDIIIRYRENYLIEDRKFNMYAAVIEVVKDQEIEQESIIYVQN